MSKARKNINFRQSFRDRQGSRQASVWEHINKNLPYRIFRDILRTRLPQGYGGQGKNGKS